MKPAIAVIVTGDNDAGSVYLLLYVVIGLLYLGISYVYINKRRPISGGVLSTFETWRWLVFFFAFFWPVFFLMDFIRMRPSTRLRPSSRNRGDSRPLPRQRTTEDPAEEAPCGRRGRRPSPGKTVEAQGFPRRSARGAAPRTEIWRFVSGTNRNRSTPGLAVSFCWACDPVTAT